MHILKKMGNWRRMASSANHGNNIDIDCTFIYFHAFCHIIGLSHFLKGAFILDCAPLLILSWFYLDPILCSCSFLSEEFPFTFSQRRSQLQERWGERPWRRLEMSSRSHRMSQVPMSHVSAKLTYINSQINVDFWYLLMIFADSSKTARPQVFISTRSLQLGGCLDRRADRKIDTPILGLARYVGGDSFRQVLAELCRWVDGWVNRQTMNSQT